MGFLSKQQIFDKLLELKLISEGKTIVDYDYKTLGIMLKDADAKDADQIDPDQEKESDNKSPLKEGEWSQDTQKYSNRFYIIPRKKVFDEEGNISWKEIPTIYKNGIWYYEDGKTECSYWENLNKSMQEFHCSRGEIR